MCTLTQKIHKNHKLRIIWNKEHMINYYQLKEIGKKVESPQYYAEIGQN